MPITLQCGCGKRVGVSDALAGRSIRCPQCGQSMAVGAAPPPRKAPAKKPWQTLEISGGTVSFITGLAILIAMFMAFKLGPMRVWTQMDQLIPKAGGEVTDVVSFALQSYLSEQKLYNPRKSHRAPAVQGPVEFFRPGLVLTMPANLPFVGMTNQGKFSGIYNTRTGEIAVKIAWGGSTVGGLIVTGKALGVIEVTGRDVGGFPRAEIDGRSLKIIYPPVQQRE